MIRQLDQAAAKARTRRAPPLGRPDGPPVRAAIPPEEREVVAHKSFAIDRATLDEAAFDMEVLDYDFFLFTDADDGRDKVVHRDADGEVHLATEPPNESVDEALERLDAGGEPFVFFCDVDTRPGRGRLPPLRRPLRPHPPGRRLITDVRFRREKRASLEAAAAVVCRSPRRSPHAHVVQSR